MKQKQSQHQVRQMEVINNIEKQIEHNSLNFSTVDPVADFGSDRRLCLTGVHFPTLKLIDPIVRLIEPLRKLFPQLYYYRPNSLHMTIKNIRVINDPPRFTDKDVERSLKSFDEVVPFHHAFHVYFYRLLLFPANLALIGTTDPELDNLVLDLDQKLKARGVPDDKIYSNKKYFFCNVTLARFNKPVSPLFRQKIADLSSSINMPPYVVNSVSLIACNAVLSKCHTFRTWPLKPDILTQIRNPL